MSALVKESRLGRARWVRRDMMNLVTDHGRGNVYRKENTNTRSLIYIFSFCSSVRLTEEFALG